MNKRVLSPILLVVAFLCLVYAIYRSTAIRITTTENGRETIYGEPQHGLILGLCIFAGLCVVSAVALLFKKDPVTMAEQPIVNRRIV